MKRHLGVLLGAAMVALSACGGQPSGGATTTVAPTTDPATTVAPTATSTTTTTVAPTTTVDPTGELVRCQSPEGFSVGYPASWSVNPGEVVPGCTQFHPEPFRPSGTEDREAAITAYVDPVPFAEAVTADVYRDADRAATAIDGLQAVRIEFRTTEEALWPEGTPVTLYAVDLSVGPEGEPRTLFLDTIGLSSFDYERNRTVLDQMAPTVEVTLEGVPEDQDVVARYGGASGFRVEGTVDGDEVCLRIPPEGEPVCTDRPGPREVASLEPVDLGPILAGVSGQQVFRVTAELEDGRSSSFLPAPIGEDEVRGFAFTLFPDEVTRVVAFDAEGAQLGNVRPTG